MDSEIAMDERRSKRRRRRSKVIATVLRCGQQLMDDEGDTSEEELGEWGGRVPGSKNVKRIPSTWEVEYLSATPVYPEKEFRRRFGIPILLFWRIHQDLIVLKPELWGTRMKSNGRKGIPSTIKILACLRLLRTGDSYDRMDDGCKMAEETLRVYFIKFLKDMKELYAEMYLNRRPTRTELKEIESEYNDAGFEGCAGCLDCMKLKWKNCPFAEKGQYHNPKEGKLATIVVEAWCDRSLYIWSWFAGRAGTNNDLNVLAVSPLMSEILRGDFAFEVEEPYKISENGSVRKQLYFLGDGIYPNWPLFAKPIHQPTTDQEQVYTKRQEAIRKDIERCFGVIQARFEVLRRENRRWVKGDIVRTSEVCAILHNMLINMEKSGEVFDEENDNLVMEMYNDEQEVLQELDTENNNHQVPLENMFNSYAESLLHREYEMTSRTAFHRLQDELITNFNSGHEESSHSSE